MEKTFEAEGTISRWLELYIATRYSGKGTRSPKCEPGSRLHIIRYMKMKRKTDRSMGGLPNNYMGSTLY